MLGLAGPGRDDAERAIARASASWSARLGRWPPGPSSSAWTSRRPASTPPSRQALGARLRHIIDAGITIFLVDHDMGLVLNVCDYIYVIEFGAIIAQGTPDEIRATRG